MYAIICKRGKATNYILLFLLSHSSFLDCGLVPFPGISVASSLIEGESVLLVNTGKAREKTKINPDENDSWADKIVSNHFI